MQKLSGWPLIWLLYCFGLLATASVGKMFAIVGAIAEDFSIQPTLASWLISCVVVLAIVGLPMVGRLADRFGARRMLALGAIVGLLANALAVASHAFAVLFAARILEGVSFSLILVCGTTLMAGTNTGARQTAGMAIWATAGPAGIGISQALSGLAAGGGWRQVFVWSAAACVLALFATAFLPELAAKRSDPDTSSEDLLSNYRNVPLLRLCITCTLLTLFSLGIASVFPTYMHHLLGMSISQASSIGGLASLAAILGSLCAGWLLGRKVPAARLSTIGFVLMGALGALAYVPMVGAVGVAAALIASTAALGLSSGVNAAMLPRLVASPTALGAGIGMYYQFANVGMLLGAPLGFAVYVAGASAGILVLALVMIPIMVAVIPRISVSLAE